MGSKGCPERMITPRTANRTVRRLANPREDWHPCSSTGASLAALYVAIAPLPPDDCCVGTIFLAGAESGVRRLRLGISKSTTADCAAHTHHRLCRPGLLSPGCQGARLQTGPDLPAIFRNRRRGHILQSFSAACCKVLSVFAKQKRTTDNGVGAA